VNTSFENRNTAHADGLTLHGRNGIHLYRFFTDGITAFALFKVATMVATLRKAKAEECIAIPNEVDVILARLFRRNYGFYAGYVLLWASGT
jgi:hypothetical protein